MATVYRPPPAAPGRHALRVTDALQPNPNARPKPPPLLEVADWITLGVCVGAFIVGSLLFLVTQ